MYVSVFWLCFPFLLSLIVVVLRVDIWISVLVLVKLKTIACLTVRGKNGWVWYVCGWMCLFRQQRRGRKSETPLETVRDWVVLFVCCCCSNARVLHRTIGTEKEERIEENCSVAEFALRCFRGVGGFSLLFLRQRRGCQRAVTLRCWQRLLISE